MCYTRRYCLQMAAVFLLYKCMNMIFFLFQVESHCRTNTEMKRSFKPTLEVVRWCSSASGARSWQSCWTERSSPPRRAAAGRRRPPGGAGRTGEAARTRGRATAERSRRQPGGFRDQKGRKRIQRRETCSHTHEHSQRSTHRPLVSSTSRDI